MDSSGVASLSEGLKAVARSRLRFNFGRLTHHRRFCNSRASSRSSKSTTTKISNGFLIWNSSLSWQQHRRRLIILAPCISWIPRGLLHFGAPFKGSLWAPARGIASHEQASRFANTFLLPSHWVDPGAFRRPTTSPLWRESRRCDAVAVSMSRELCPFNHAIV